MILRHFALEGELRVELCHDPVADAHVPLEVVLAVADLAAELAPVDKVIVSRTRI